MKSFPFYHLLFLVLCVSPYACSSRYLGLLNKETKGQLQLNGKDFSKQNEVPEKTMIVQCDHVLVEKNKNKGIDQTMPSSREVFHETTKIKGWKMEARSTMESKNEDDTDENIKSKENEKNIVEDVVVMDYAQPHRKPPIHNFEP